jgi:hypothetical protein
MASKFSDFKTLRYPKEKIDASDDYLEIQVLEYVPPGLGLVGGSTGFQVKSSDDPDSQLSEKNKKIKATIILPIPKDLSPDAKSVEWGENSMNSVAAAVAGGAKDIIGGKGIDSARNTVLKGVGKLAGAIDGNLQQNLQAGLAIYATQQLFGQEADPLSAMTRQTGAVINQNQELLFKGVTLRDFAFNFTMTPRFREEAEEVREIIRYFKKSSSAKKSASLKGAEGGSQGLFIGSPDVYQIAYKSGNQDHPYLNQFKVCALMGITVNYGGAGVYATYADGAPIQMNMTLSFRELTPVYFEDYGTEKGLRGTGY